MRRSLAACTAALSLTILISAPAAAHEEYSLHALTVIDRVSPEIDGLEIRIVHLGAPALSVLNRTERVLEVEGEDGEPYLRIGPRGVFANAASPTTYKSIDPNNDLVPRHLDPAAHPRWVRFSRGPSWSWFDPRLVYATGRTEWSVPMSVHGSPVEAIGGFEALEGHGHFITESDVPEVGGLDVRLVQGPVPALYVRNDTHRTLRVSGSAGEPFLNIGPDGVWANVLSPSYYQGGSLTIKKVPAFADATADPRWKKVSDAPVWGWLEYRAALAPQQQERDLLGDDERTVSTWTSPMRLGRRNVSVTGRVLWVPPVAPTLHRASAHDWQPLIAVVRIAAFVLLALFALILLRSKQRVETA